MLIGMLSGAFSGATCLRSNCRIDRDFPSSIAVLSDVCWFFCFRSSVPSLPLAIELMLRDGDSKLSTSTAGA